jgi:peptidoglycan hydrolase-like protein with peptidoglycan-binding domain/3D (Asp-Asp-Asp) domain-containing protein
MKKCITFFLFVGFLFLLYPSVQANRLPGEKRMFTITGYYSPLPGQLFYITGDYASEIRLNGSGIAGADGTPVYPGMIAAPTSYSFGTKICIPSLGCGKIHDRGGAIVEQGKRTLARHDRLDIWMGYGDEGLRRALAWGVQHLECEMYDEDSSVHVGMNFEIPPSLHQILDLPKKQIFTQNLSLGVRGKEVYRLQEVLKKLGFFEDKLTDFFGSKTEKAVFDFQKKHFLIKGKNSIGAGIFGPITRDKLATILYHQEIERKIREVWENFHFEENLQRGIRNQSVLKLQEILVSEELMEVAPTGFFGPKTEAALIEFQVLQDIIPDSTSVGVGRVGHITREKLNEVLKQKKKFINTEKKEILAYQKLRNRMTVLTQKADTLGKGTIGQK